MEFIKDSIKVLTGQTIQRTLSLVMVPVTARLIGPSDYGIFQTALSVISIATIVCSFSFEASIAVAQSQTDALHRTIGTVFIGSIFGLIFFLATYQFDQYLSQIFSTLTAMVIIYLSPIYIPLIIASLSFQNYVSYIGKFSFIPIADISSSLGGYVLLIISYFMVWQDYRCLIISGLGALIIRLSIFIYAMKVNYEDIQKDIFDPPAIARSLWSARNFAKYNLPSNLLNSASVNLPTTLMAMYFPASIVGLFSMARTIIYIPTSLSGQALGQVFYPQAAQMHREGRGLKDVTWGTFVYSCQLALFPALLIAVSAPIILPLILGSKWIGIAPYCLLILPMVLFNAVQTQIGIGFIFSILDQQYKIVIGNIVLFAGRFLPMLLILFFTSSPYIVVLFHSLGGALAYAFLLYWIFVTVSISPMKAFYVWFYHLLLSLVSVIPIMTSFFYGGFVVKIVSLMFSILIFTAIGWHRFLTERQKSIIILDIKKIIYKTRHSVIL